MESKNVVYTWKLFARPISKKKAPVTKKKQIDKKNEKNELLFLFCNSNLKIKVLELENI